MDINESLAQARKPVRIVNVNGGKALYIGDDEFPHPIERDSIHVTTASRRMNRLTLTIFVGEVTLETEAKPDPDGQWNDMHQAPNS